MGRNTGDEYQLAAHIKRIKRVPGRWSLEYTNVPNHLVAIIRLRKHPVLRREHGGLIEARASDVYRDSDGKRRANIWMRFTPRPREERHEAQEHLDSD